MARYEFSDILYEIILDNPDDIKGHETELSELVFKDFKPVVETVNPKYDLDTYSHYLGELDAFFIWYPDNLNKLEEEMDRGITDGLLTEFNKIVSKHLLKLTGKQAITGTVNERHRWADYDDVDVEGELADEEELLSGKNGEYACWELRLWDASKKEVINLLRKKENRDTEVVISSKFYSADDETRTLDIPEEVFTNGYAGFYIPLAESLKYFEKFVVEAKSGNKQEATNNIHKIADALDSFWLKLSQDKEFIDKMTPQGNWDYEIDKRSTIQILGVRNEKVITSATINVGSIIFTKKE